MRSLNFNTGIKEFDINGDKNRIIRIDTTDLNLGDRIETGRKELRKLAKKFETLTKTTNSDDKMLKIIDDYDKQVRQQIDYMFDSPVSDIAFGNTNCLSVSGGNMLFENFLNALLPEIEKDIKDEEKASKKRIEKYTSQVKK